MPSVDQLKGILQSAAEAPVNNMIVLFAIGIVAFLIISAILIWKFAPVLIKLYEKQAETNEKLTTIVGQHSEQVTRTIESLDKNTSEVSRQTTAINAQTVVIEGQSRDLRSYQTLVSDTLSGHTDQLRENTEAVTALKATVEQLSVMSSQLKTAIDDKSACTNLETQIQTIRDEILNAISQQQTKRATSENGAVPGTSAN